MAQSKIDFFSVHSVKSISSDTEYDVTLGPEGWECTCPHGKYRGNKETHCRHVQAVLLEQLRDKIKYLLERTTIPSQAFFDSVDSVSNYFIFNSDQEYNTICWTSLLLAKSQGYITADHLHEVFENKFQHDSRIIGSALGNLKSKGYLIQDHMVKSERPVCHGRMIGYFVLSESGQELF